MVSALKIFQVFLRLGLTAFGGSATVAYIRDLAVKRHGWLADDAFRDDVALSLGIPGATPHASHGLRGVAGGGK